MAQLEAIPSQIDTVLDAADAVYALARDRSSGRRRCCSSAGTRGTPWRSRAR